MTRSSHLHSSKADKSSQDKLFESVSSDLFTADSLKSRVAQNSGLALLVGKAVELVLPEVEAAGWFASYDFFYYDFISKSPADERLLVEITRHVKRLIQENLEFEPKTMVRQNAEDFLRHIGLSAQAEAVSVVRDDVVSLCKFGPYFDLCSQPTCASSSEIEEFTLYDIERKELFYPAFGHVSVLRVKGFSSSDKKSLKQRVKQIEQEKKRKEMSFENLQFMKAFPFPTWLDRGMIFRDVVKSFWHSQVKKYGYKSIQSAPFGVRSSKKKLFLEEHSSPYLFQAPISCEKNDAVEWEEEGQVYSFIDPFEQHLALFNLKKEKTKELPFKVAEVMVRKTSVMEKDVLGLFQTKAQTQDILSSFCRQEQFAKELEDAFDMVFSMMNFFGIEVHCCITYPQAFSEKLSEKRAKDRLPSGFCALIQSKEELLREKMSPQATLTVGFSKLLSDDVFIEFFALDSQNCIWKIGQLYLKEDKKGQEPFCSLSFSSFISLERTLAYLLDQGRGALLPHLTPVQVRIVQVEHSLDVKGASKAFQVAKNEGDSEESKKIRCFAKEISSMLDANSIRCEIFETFRDELSRVVFDTATQKIPLLVVIGAEEAKNRALSIRFLTEEKKSGSLNLENFLQTIKEYLLIPKTLG